MKHKCPVEWETTAVFGQRLVFTLRLAVGMNNMFNISSLRHNVIPRSWLEGNMIPGSLQTFFFWEGQRVWSLYPRSPQLYSKLVQLVVKKIHFCMLKQDLHKFWIFQFRFDLKKNLQMVTEICWISDTCTCFILFFSFRGHSDSGKSVTSLINK